MNQNLKFIGTSLSMSTEQFAKGQISSFEYARERESAISCGLTEMAKDFGVDLKQPLFINSNGDYTLTCVSGFKDMIQQLNANHPRCGVFGSGDAILSAESTWCYMNHFNAEKMVVRFCEQEMELSVVTPKQPEKDVTTKDVKAKAKKDGFTLG